MHDDKLMTDALRIVERRRDAAAAARADFIAAIHEARKCGETVAAIGKAAGVSHQRVSQILRGE